MLVLLEGGYNLSATAKSTEATIKALLAKEPKWKKENIDLDSLRPSVVATIGRTAKAHSEYWGAAKKLYEEIQDL